MSSLDLDLNAQMNNLELAWRQAYESSMGARADYQSLAASPKAKANLLECSGELDPLNVIRNHPWISVSSAAAVGAVAAQAPDAKTVRFLATVVTPMLTRVTKILSLAAVQLGASLASGRASPSDVRTTPSDASDRSNAV